MSVPRWLAKFSVTAGWEKHRARGSAGGVDYGAPAGTVIYAPAAGVVYVRKLADQASVVGVRYDNGGATEFVHARFPLEPGTRAAAGRAIAISDGRPGFPGAGVGPTASTGAHIHVHDMLNGVRVRPFTTVPTALAGGGITAFADESEEDEDDMIRIIAHVKDNGAVEEVALVWPLLPAGYLTAKGGTATAVAWLRMYSPRLDGTPHQQLNRDQYLGAIEAAKVTRAGYVAATPASQGAVLDDSRILAALDALGSKIEALPAEIDRYADGKKNS